VADEAQTETTTTTESTTDAATDAAKGTAQDQTSSGGTEGETDAGTILGGEAASEEGEAADGEEGAAEGAPEAYELTAPEGFTLDEESIAEATPIFKELNLTNEQANKLMPVAAKFAERIQQQGQQAILTEVQAQRKAWAEEAKADSQIGGAKWGETESLAARALDTLGYPKGSTFRSFLTDSGLGNHPEMIRAMRKVGEMVSEDGDFVRGDAAAQAKPSREQVLYPDDVRKQGA
jgi:hypothetical protein